MAAPPQPSTAKTPDRPPALETPVPGHRRGTWWRGGWQRAGFRSVRTQLLIPILVATAGIVVLGSVQTSTAIDSSRDAQRAQVLARAAVGTVRLVYEIDRELAETIALRQRNGQAGAQLVAAQRARTDIMIGRYQSESRRARDAAPVLDDVVAGAEKQISQLERTRAGALGATPAAVNASEQSYADLVDALLVFADALSPRIVDEELANAVRAIGVIAKVAHYDSIERDRLRAIFARGTITQTEYGDLAMVFALRDEYVDEFERLVDRPGRQIYRSLVRGSDVDAVTQFRGDVRSGNSARVDPDAWYVASSGLIRRLYVVSVRLSERIDASAVTIANGARRRAWGTAVGAFGVAGLALVTAVLLAVRISRRLRALRDAALVVARQDLPDAIRDVASGAAAGSAAANLATPGVKTGPLGTRAGPPGATTGPGGPKAGSAGAKTGPLGTKTGQDGADADAVAAISGDLDRPAIEVTLGLASSRDEVGEVADAFASVHRSALRLASQQAALRVDVTRMAEILARRIRTLITRQLRLLDEFEREETDPDALARLFALDHLAARLRRNGENLLVLAGGEPGRSFNKAFPLAAVVTAAASEIEEFARVEATLGEVMVAGPVVGDLVHLLAELLENATAFSPPTSPVRVDARLTLDGATIRVHDSGIGITANRIGEINARLARPVTLTSASAGTMGLHVVSHLAARHGVRVQLHSTGTGTVAYVNLPHSTLVVQSAVSSASRSVTGELEATHHRVLVAGRLESPAATATAVAASAAAASAVAASAVAASALGAATGSVPMVTSASRSSPSTPPLPAATATPLAPSGLPMRTGPSATPGSSGPSATPGSSGPSVTPGSSGPSVTPGSSGPLAAPGSVGPLVPPARSASPAQSRTAPVAAAYAPYAGRQGAGSPGHPGADDNTDAWFRPRAGDGEHSSRTAPVVPVAMSASATGHPQQSQPSVSAPGQPPVSAPGQPSTSAAGEPAVSAAGLPRRRPQQDPTLRPPDMAAADASRPSEPLHTAPHRMVPYAPGSAQMSTFETRTQPAGAPLAAAGIPVERRPPPSDGGSAYGVGGLPNGTDGGPTRGLPRRSPGAQLAPRPASPRTPAVAATVDPEAVRARLSAFAEGVSAALRRGPNPSQGSKDS